MEKFIIKKAPEIKEELDDIEDYPQYIQDFIRTLKDKHLDYFYHNIKELEIFEVRKHSLTIREAEADYNVMENVIEYVPGSLRSNIMHELLHVSSRVELRDRILCGFMQVLNDGYGIGTGINEGYTALMDDRYFIGYDEKKYEESKTIYASSKHICRILDILLGEKNMEDMYMNADLYGLYNQLANYSSEKKAYNFIINMDIFFKEADVKSIPNVKKVLEGYKRIIYFLSECFMTRFNMQLQNKEITKEEYNKMVDYVKYLLDNQMVYFKVIKSKKMGSYINHLENVAKKNLKSRVS